jgi:hypothetical protein
LSKRPAGALAGIAMVLLLAAPAGAAVRRDTIVGAPGSAAARISAGASALRYPIDDGSGTTVAISVTPACAASCTAVEPQAIADFLGTLIHGAEMELLTVQLDAPVQIGYDCGYGANACYYPSENKVVLSGDTAPAADGASRELVLAHEYGHHVANHRPSPAPFPAAIDWGPPRWATREEICRRSRAGSVFPGNEGGRYFRDPGEAFAESFARYRFPDSGLPWRYLPALNPDTAAFEAIRKDTLEPWLGRSSFLLAGRVPPRRAGAAVRSIPTPLDGAVSLRPARFRHRYSLSVLGPAGRVLRSTRRGLSFRHRLNFTVCGQHRLRIRLRSTRRRGEGFRLQVRRP